MKIKIRENGPYLVDGEDVTIVNSEGEVYQIKDRPFALCRCGASGKRPFCDGTHRNISFDGSDGVF